MDWTLVRNLLQACPLLFVEVAFQVYRTLDPVHVPFRCVGAFLAIGGVNPPLSEAHYYSLQRPSFSLRVKRHGDGNATAKRGEQQRIRIWARILATGF